MTEEKQTILLVDDEAGLRELVKVYLENEGFLVTEAADGLEALRKLAHEKFDLVVLDVMIPMMDGLTLCKKIRSTSESLPILFLTAKGEEADRLLGFEYGADDYVVKPFSPRELTARAKALIRRTLRKSDVPKTLTFPNLVIDEASHYVEWHGRSVELTPKEFDLLCLLARTPRQVYSRGQIMSQAWEENYLAELRIVDVHVKNLREKFKAIKPFNYLHTVWGVGYKFEVPR